MSHSFYPSSFLPLPNPVPPSSVLGNLPLRSPAQRHRLCRVSSEYTWTSLSLSVLICKGAGSLDLLQDTWEAVLEVPRSPTRTHRCWQNITVLLALSQPVSSTRTWTMVALNTPSPNFPASLQWALLSYWSVGPSPGAWDWWHSRVLRAGWLCRTEAELQEQFALNR